MVFLGGLAYSISARIHNVYIARMFDPAMCNTYTFTLMAPTFVATLVVYFSHALVPGLAHLFGESEGKKVFEVVTKLMKATIVGGVILISGAVVLNREFVTIWVGPQFYGGPVINLVLCISAAVSTICLSLQNVLVAAGDFTATARASLTKAVCHISCLFVTGYFWGLPGVAAASIAGFLVSVILVQSRAVSTTVQASSVLPF